MNQSKVVTCGNWLHYISLLNLVVIVIVICGRMFFAWQPMLSFRTFFYGIQFGLVLAVIALLLLAWSYFKKEKELTKPAALSFFNGLAPILAALLVAGPGVFTLPLIHDISTDTENPPAFSAAVALRTVEDNDHEYGGESIASQQHSAYPNIKPLLTEMSTNEALAHTLDTAISLGWTVIDFGLSDVDKGDGRLEAYEETEIFGFIDDVTIRITPLETGSRIDIRSASRLGLGDIGANAARIERFVNKFKE